MVGLGRREVLAIAATLLAAWAGGWVAKRMGLPLPFLLGALLVTGTAAILGLRVFGAPLALPQTVRMYFVPVIGVAIGAAFTPDVLREAARWWPTLLGLAVFVPLAHAISFWIARCAAGVDRVTAFYGTMPGGFIEAITLGEEAGADIALLSVMQFMRLIYSIVLIPLAFAIATGAAVGSAAGAVLGHGTLTALDWGILILAGAVGALAGQRINLPAAIVTGPIIASGLVHLFGWVTAGPPVWLIDLTQMVIGASLGARFAGRGAGVLLSGLRIAAMTVAATLLLGAGFAASLHGIVGESWQAVLLAFAPGGLVEMSLVALSLEISVIYVTAHHVLRILVAVFTARFLAARILKGGAQG
ncbi:AbrB family transcriptional regulator [Ovoidimarina sediminis]|uniref:AbrB family transcriptional regulator n=1 Tax=Ovoidimarina sediminis TaxID=3079856 RepID=UPI002909A541|nr:AbrB family transcriptional regulator [Rhodophyticola sp. MJ-SS7]MDU8943314.1 AbrB family transcriptional regulator [Rhodophyticola sp. MJ-SS7]